MRYIKMLLSSILEGIVQARKEKAKRTFRGS